MRLRTILLLRAAHVGMLVVLCGACGRDARPSGDAAVTQRDSAGIVIVETPGSAARVTSGWKVGDVPDVQLGTVDGEGPEQFHRIGGMVGRYVRYVGGITGLPDGRIVVVDGSSAELRFFDREGRFLNKVGGVGHGPGEFQEPLLISNIANDSLLIYDIRRATLYSADGGGYRHMRPDELLGIAGAVKGVSKSGTLSVGWPNPRMGQARQSLPYTVDWTNRPTRLRKTVVEFEKLLYTLPPYYGLDVPFTAPPAAAMGKDGFFFVTSGGAPEVRAFDDTARLIRIFRIAEAPRPVQQKDLNAVIDFQVNRFPDVPAAQIRSVFAQMDVPDHWPTFRDVRVDREGWIWAELFRSPQDSTPQWMVFDPSGVARGTLNLPTGLEVHDIGNDYVLGRWLDENRVEYVRRYRLDRGH